MLILFLIYRSVNSKKDDEEVFEIDKTNWNDFLYMGCYARDIFKYLKQREVSYTMIVFEYQLYNLFFTESI